MSTLLIIDTSSYIHRAYHGYKEKYPLRDAFGKPIWVAFGLIKKFNELIEHYNPDLVVSCEDTRDNSFLRKKLYPDYKNKRTGKGTNDDLTVQFEDAIDIVRRMGIFQISINGYEADDAIACIVQKFKKPGLRIIVVTGDKDMAQLVDSKNDVEVHLNNGKGSGKLKYEELITESDVVNKYGVEPSKIPDLFGLIGDTSDSIPGVSGMHENIAKVLLDRYHFNNLDDLYNRLNDLRDDIPGMSAHRLRLILESEREKAFLSRTLATPLPLELNITIGSFIRDHNPVPVLQFMKNHGIENLNSKIGFNCDLQEMMKYMSMVRLLIACNNSYYRTGKSTLSDKEYDMMLEEIKEMEKKSGYKHPDSPTQHVGSDKTNFGVSVKHDVPMISLDNSYEPETLYKWMQSIQKEYTEPVKFSVEWKWDGISLALHYKNGILERAVTRGDGTHGDDVTQNAKELMNVPYRLKDTTFTNEIRGEVLIKKNNFDLINRERKKEGLAEFANPRNASSVIRSGKNPKDIKDRLMEFRAYKLVHSDTVSSEDIETIKNLGFEKVSEHIEVITADLDLVMHTIAKYDKEKQFFAYPTDGLVVSVISKKIREEIGETNKFPRWAKAYKFNPEGGVSQLLDIRWQVGRKGTITPVAIIEPVSVSGSIIRKASLHNVDRLAEKNLKYGDMVLVEKGGEIIPQIIRVVSSHQDNQPVNIPTTCPCCGSPLEREKDKVALLCVNDTCPDKVKAYLEYIVSKDILDLKGFGEAVIETLYDRGVRDIIGLFDMKTYDGLEFLDSYGEASKAVLVDEIKEVQESGLELYRLIASLGIPLVGKTIGKKIASISSLEEFLNGNLHSGLQIGDKARQNILNYLNSPTNIVRIRKLLELIPIKNTMNVMKTNKFVGRTFCISGKLPTTKEKIEKIIRENGGTMLSGVSANLSYLICEELGNSKPEKASKIGVPIISYKEFLELTK